MMKKVVITVVGALMLTVGGISATNLTHTEAANHSSNVEYQNLSKTVDLSGYAAEVVVDNRGKRITLYEDANGQVKYKTILVKKTGMLKVIKLSQ